MSDLISRQTVIDAVTKYCIKYDLRELLADIECLPTAEKRGKWKERKPPEGSWGYGSVFTCSECGEEVDCVSENYCPNCGARMEESR